MDVEVVFRVYRNPFEFSNVRYAYEKKNKRWRETVDSIGVEII